MSDEDEGTIRGRVLKNLLPPTAEQPLGVILAFAAVSWKRNLETRALEPYFDFHDDHITDGAIVKGAFKFAKGKRTMLAMHDGDPVGEVIWSFPMTREIAAAFKFVGEEYGWLVGLAPANAEAAKKCADGTYSGVSIGGWFTRLRKAYTAGTCPECEAAIGPGNCKHQIAEAA